MSRSYRKRPFASITGNLSAKWDKQKAHRGVRRKQDLVLRVALKDGEDFENFTLPHPLECHHNDVWGWIRDGSQRWQWPTAADWYRYLEAQEAEEGSWLKHYYGNWPPDWFTEMMRK